MTAQLNEGLLAMRNRLLRENRVAIGNLGVHILNDHIFIPRIVKTVTVKGAVALVHRIAMAEFPKGKVRPNFRLFGMLMSAVITIILLITSACSQENETGERENKKISNSHGLNFMLNTG